MLLNILQITGQPLRIKKNSTENVNSTKIKKLQSKIPNLHIFTSLKVIEKSLECITQQDYEHKNIEVILVDDGSPDSCGDLCDMYALKDCRIKVIHKTNGGLSDARNVGIDASNADYILLIDSDDYIEPNTIETLYNLICK